MKLAIKERLEGLGKSSGQGAPEGGLVRRLVQGTAKQLAPME